MAETKVLDPMLSQRDWALVAHLLECKQRELLAEIRHTDKRAFREALRERLDQIEGLLAKMPLSGPEE